MQTLYALQANTSGTHQANAGKGAEMLDEKLDRTLDIFTVCVLYVIRVAQYAEIDARNRASKYLPTEEDLRVNTKIAGNEFIWKVLENETFKTALKERKLDQYLEINWVKKIYQQLVQKDAYQEYIQIPSREAASEKNIIQLIWEELMRNNEGLIDYFSDELPGWEDDREMIHILMENFFRLSSRINFLALLSPDKKEYAHDLLRTTIEKEEYCKELIQPKLINWDAERVALVDLLLLRMGVCELLYFPTIPTRVTINEYIEISKQYSTLQSGQFVNGVLDNILKELEKENKIHKEQRTRK